MENQDELMTTVLTNTIETTPALVPDAPSMTLPMPISHTRTKNDHDDHDIEQESTSNVNRTCQSMELMFATEATDSHHSDCKAISESYPLNKSPAEKAMQSTSVEIKIENDDEDQLDQSHHSKLPKRKSPKISNLLSPEMFRPSSIHPNSLPHSLGGIIIDFHSDFQDSNSLIHKDDYSTSKKSAKLNSRIKADIEEESIAAGDKKPQHRKDMNNKNIASQNSIVASSLKFDEATNNHTRSDSPIDRKDVIRSLNDARTPQNNNSEHDDSPSFSMTLAISRNDTRRVFSASRDFNLEIQKIREEKYLVNHESEINITEKDENSSLVNDSDERLPTPLEIKAEPSASPHSKLNKSSPIALQNPLKVLLRKAAHRCSHPLIKTFLTKTITQTKGFSATATNYWNLDTSLLFFLDSDKSIKILMAFDLLSTTCCLDVNIDHNEENKKYSEPHVIAFEKDASRCDHAEMKNSNSTNVFASTDSSSMNIMSHKDHIDTGISMTVSTPFKDLNEELADKLIKEDATTSKLIDRAGVIRLFYSFLSSISICVHGDRPEAKVSVELSATSTGKSITDNEEVGNEDNDASSALADSRAHTPTVHNKSPISDSTNIKDATDLNSNNDQRDWKGSDRTENEIMEIVVFAADSLMEFANNEAKEVHVSSIESSTSSSENLKVSFDIFGKWYNSGGFSLVPWLELLDLSKWDTHHARNSEGDREHYSFGSLSSKRVRTYEPNTPGFESMGELIGSPTSFFAEGAAVGITPRTAKKTDAISPFTNSISSDPHSLSAMFGAINQSRTVISFDFAHAASSFTIDQSKTGNFRIDISEENLVMLRSLVHRTGLVSLSPQMVEKVMMQHCRHDRQKDGEGLYVISRDQYNKFIRDVVPKGTSNSFDHTEIQNFSNYFTNFFTCFDCNWTNLKKDEVNAKELLVGFSFLCAGNKSAKLAAAFEMLDIEKNGYLTQRGLLQYLRSYLTMLAGISLLSSSKKKTHQIRKKLMTHLRHDAFLAVENGAKWTLGNFLRVFESQVLHQRGSTRSNAIRFEDFANWYTDGGYKVAPWLELLDLNKFLSLIGDSSWPLQQQYVQSSAPAEVLFTFPLANNRSLVVLRDDALYVRSVVVELGLLSLTCEDIWETLYIGVVSINDTTGESSTQTKNMSIKVDQDTFVKCMMPILCRTKQRKNNSISNLYSSPGETLKNLYLSFDLSQNNRVPLNQLMCGLTLLCGGKKSSKLVFAFNLFGSDGLGSTSKKKPYMGHEDFVYFFQSFLIVMFSCCNQSLDLSADAVSQYISETAESVADDVMKYWQTKKIERVQFDHFSEWYNEGGFETVPWLELLDLNKWVLVDQPNPPQPNPPILSTPAPEERISIDHISAAHTPASYEPSPNPDLFRELVASPKQVFGPRPSSHVSCPPAPPDDDPLFDLDISAVDAEDDDMDFILQHGTEGTGEVENVNYVDPATSSDSNPPLKFHLLTHDPHQIYMIFIGPNQVSLFQKIVSETGLYRSDPSTVCSFILNEAKLLGKNNERILSKKAFNTALKKVCLQISQSQSIQISNRTQHELSTFSDKLFDSFDRSKAGTANAIDIACGLTLLCCGRKSDKLEHVFELLDEDGDSLLSQQDINRFIQSFLIVLMTISPSLTLLDGGIWKNNNFTVAKAVESASEWATSKVFQSLKPKDGRVSFDDFANWYTKGGYESIPWLELLDLRKWVLGEK